VVDTENAEGSIAMRIFKYIIDPDKLDFNGSITLNLPRRAEIISAAEQRGDIVVYAVIDAKEKKIDEYLIWVVGTGHEIPEAVLDRSSCKFLGTVSLQDGEFMFHVYWTKPKKQ
jgi:predicted ABC-type ATPase